MEKLKALWKNLGKNRWLFLVGALGAILLLLAPMLTEKEESVPQTPDAEVYRKALTEELELLCEGVVGAGDCRVFLTLESGARALYEKNQSSSGESVASAGGDALLVGYQMPRVTGVAVVAEGGNLESVRYEIASLLSASLGISTARIHIASSH